jgi:hypothetical protein
MALNHKQIKAIELLVYSPHMTLNVICKEVDVSRETLHRWRNDNEEFKEALQKATKDRWKAAEQLAIDTMISLAAEGNIQAAKYICDSLGYKPVDKVEANVNAKAQVMFVDDLKEEQDESSA